MIISKYGQIESSSITLTEFVFFCVTKSFKTLKSIEIQAQAGMIEDSMNLFRSVYENYLNITYVLCYPEKLNDLVAARIGLEKGTHEYLKRNNGKIDKRTIVNKATGELFLGHTSNFVMASSSKYQEDVVIFDILYENLSRFTHPSILVFKNYVNNGRIDPHQKGNIDEVIILSLFISMLLFETLLNIKLSDQIKNDIKKSIGSLKSCILSIFSDFANEQDETYILEKFIYKRTSKIS